MKHANGGDTGYLEHRDLGLEAMAAGRVEEALKALGHAVVLRPRLPEAHYNMGKCFGRAGRFEAARHAYIWALEVDPAFPAALSALEALPTAPAKREDFEAGQSLRIDTMRDSYKVLGVRRSGFGAVYNVEGESDGIRFALMTFQARYLWNDEDRERFEQEALTWARLYRHPNVVRAYWLEDIEGLPCLVLEYVEGGDLAGVLAEGLLAPEGALELGMQFCDGMVHAHDRVGIVHRDVKPSNCLLTKEGEIKVAGFGLASAFGEVQEAHLELAGLGAEVRALYTSTPGTPNYMAPEQFEAGVALYTRTDIYAFGIMLYEMVTVCVPRDGRGAPELIQAAAGYYDLPARLEELILHCVQPDPGKRPSDFGYVRLGLQAAYRALTMKPAPPPAEPILMGAMTWRGRGATPDTVGSYEDALSCYERVVEIDPGSVGAWANKGIALRDFGRHEEALACYERAIEIETRHGKLWNLKGAALDALCRPEEALACFERAIEIERRDGEAWNNKGAALGDLGHLEEALGCFEQAFDTESRDSSIWNNKGLTLLCLGRPEEALACFEQALETEPRDSDASIYKGAVLIFLGGYEEALGCYEKVLQIEPRNSDASHNKGAVLLVLGRYEEALGCFGQVLEVDPGNSGARRGRRAAQQALYR